MRRLGRWLEKRSKAWLYRWVSAGTSPAKPATPELLRGARRILLVRPNFRLGNALISARLIKAFADGHPDIEIDFIGTDTTAVLLNNMPLTHQFSLQRSMLLRPWQLFHLWRSLQHRHYDLVIQVADTSLTGWLCTKMSGARHTLGAQGRLATSYDWVYETATEDAHAYDVTTYIAKALQLPCEAKPWMVISEDEQHQAQKLLQQLSAQPFDVGVFVGGHLDKRLPLVFWQSLMSQLNTLQTRFIVLVGPEEETLRPHLEAYTGDYGTLAPCMPLRIFAACLKELPRLITPDTGPMHMAVALDVPVTVILNIEGSMKFAPHGPHDTVLFQPALHEIVLTLTADSVLTEAMTHAA
jgi:heptosyltransferase-3